LGGEEKQLSLDEMFDESAPQAQPEPSDKLTEQPKLSKRSRPEIENETHGTAVRKLEGS
jgi:hypothetical protein